MKKDTVKHKSFRFALRIVKLFQFLKEQKQEFIMSKQVMRSGTAIGALIREAEHAESKADFIHKMAIAQKESNETAYWLELLHQSEFLNQKEFESLIQEQQELSKMLASILLTSKGVKKSDE